MNKLADRAGIPEGELIAIFAAAIAYAAGVAAARFRVVSYRKTGQTSPVWNIQGRSDYMADKL
jgi:hypothetical protein